MLPRLPQFGAGVREAAEVWAAETRYNEIYPVAVVGDNELLFTAINLRRT